MDFCTVIGPSQLFQMTTPLSSDRSGYPRTSEGPVDVFYGAWFGHTE
jgi:hypothetical protein